MPKYDDPLIILGEAFPVSLLPPPTPLTPPSHPIPTLRVYDSDSLDQSVPVLQSLYVNVGHGRPWLANVGCNSGKRPNCDILDDGLSWVNAVTLICVVSFGVTGIIKRLWSFAFTGS